MKKPPFPLHNLPRMRVCVCVCVCGVCGVHVCMCACVCVTFVFVYMGTSCKWHKTTAYDHNHMKYIHFVIKSYKSNHDKDEKFWNLSWSSLSTCHMLMQQLTGQFHQLILAVIWMSRSWPNRTSICNSVWLSIDVQIMAWMEQRDINLSWMSIDVACSEGCDVTWSTKLAVNSDNEFVFKTRALHCTPLEFRTGFLAGGF